MEHRRTRFSNKLVLMLGKALVDLLNDSEASIHELIYVCKLPTRLGGWDFRKGSGWGGQQWGPEDYVRRVAEHGDVVELLEAIHEEATAHNPAVLTKGTRVSTSGIHRPDHYKPPLMSYLSLTQQLETEGFTFSGCKLVSIDSEAPQEFQDKTKLAERVRSHPELDPTTLIHHMDESDSTLGNEEWNSAASAARDFFEGLVINISVCAAQSRKGVPLILPEKARRPRFGQARADLLSDSFTTAEEDELIGALYGFQSEEGGHYGITDEQMAKLTRRFCWVLAAHLLTKYESQSGTA